MQKPIDIVINEFKENIYNTINNSNLPLCISNIIIKDICKDLEKAATENFQKVSKAYYTEIQKESHEDENNAMNLINNLPKIEENLTEENSEAIRKFNES